MKARSYLNFTDFRLVVLSIVILINVLHFFEFPTLSRFIPGSNTPPSEEYRAIHRFNTGDFKELSMDVDSIYNTHNIYTILGQHEPAYNLIIDSQAAGKVHSHVLARIVGLGRVSRVESREVDKERINSIVRDNNLKVLKGRVWEWPGHAREGRPGIEWKFVYDYIPSRDIVLLVDGSRNNPTLLFVDGSILGSTKEVGY